MVGDKPSAKTKRETTMDSYASYNTDGSYIYNDDDDDDYNEEENIDDHECSTNDLPNKPNETIEREVTLRDISDGGYKMWDMDKVQTTMKRTISKIVDVLGDGVSPSAAAVLLRKFKWDEKKLAEQYFDRQDRILKECGLVARCSGDKKESSASRGESLLSSLTKECSICFDDCRSDDMFGMACGHKFCHDCWLRYITEAVSNGTKCVYTTCPNFKCNEVITEEEVEKIATALDNNSSILSKFQDYQLKSYVEASWRMRWCPGPSCNLVAVASTAGLSGEGVCSKCDSKFCLKCSEVVHSPASCDMLSCWMEKCQNQSETINWIVTNTKKCPKCKIHIEKNQGCNHMHCSQCNFHFCWMCLRDWNVHGYEGSCNTFDIEKANENDWKKNQAEHELDRYLHNFTRFQAHSEAMQFAIEQLQKFDETGTYTMHNQDSDDDVEGSSDDEEGDPELSAALKQSLIEYGEQKKQKFHPTAMTAAYHLPKMGEEKSTNHKVWREAQTQIIECRRVLMYTYIVSYYLPTDENDNTRNKKDLHEHYQGQLQRYTEMLSEQCEKPFDGINFGEVFNLKSVVADYTRKIVELDILQDNL